ncbi:MAG: 3-dehydroquinate synthase [Pseudohongiellaceae bacterium]
MSNQAQSRPTMEQVTVELGERSYPIYIGAGLLAHPELITGHLGPGRVVIITNDTVAPLYLEQARALFADRFAEAIVLADGEAHKNLDTVATIYDRLMAGKYDRKTVLVALGGGVIGDITGFVAATYQRGIPFVQIPTTLLAQVDSSVGGKTGVNHAAGKNMIGAFYQPRCVLADTDTLATLPKREVKAGLAEVLKYGLIVDAPFFDWLAEEAEAVSSLQASSVIRAIRICCQTKADVVTRDEREGGVRALLNLGHTFGHAIETATGYGTWLHGETVAMGTVMAADLSCRLGLLDRESARRIRRTLEQDYGMPVIPPADITVEQYLDLMASDKKAEQGSIRFILLTAIGSAIIKGDVEAAALQATLQAGDRLCQ